jgi:hypothetical protein
LTHEEVEHAASRLPRRFLRKTQVFLRVPKVTISRITDGHPVNRHPVDTMTLGPCPVHRVTRIADAEFAETLPDDVVLDIWLALATTAWGDRGSHASRVPAFAPKLTAIGGAAPLRRAHAINTSRVCAGHFGLFHIVSRSEIRRFPQVKRYMRRVRFPAAPQSGKRRAHPPTFEGPTV